MLASQANIGMYANITNMDCLGMFIYVYIYEQ